MPVWYFLRDMFLKPIGPFKDFALMAGVPKGFVRLKRLQGV